MQLGLIGFPLKNGFSKAYFEKKFQLLHMDDSSYENYPLESISEFPQLLKKQTQLNGLSVTIPHKQSIIPFLHQLDKTAEEIGAVNCIQIKHHENGSSEYIGYNTDAFGFEFSLQHFLGNVKPEKALVLGIGGAAKAVIYVLHQMGIQTQLVGRTHDPSTQKIAYSELNSTHFEACQLIVNCSPIGMHPFPDEMPAIPYHFLNEQHYCFDLIYNPDETRFLELSRKQGAHTKNGLEMLHMQAEKAFEIWSSSLK